MKTIDYIFPFLREYAAGPDDVFSAEEIEEHITGRGWTSSGIGV